MNRILCVLLVIAMLTVALPSCVGNKLSQVSIQPPSEGLAIGSTVQMQVVDAKQNPVEAERLFWSSSDTRVAKVSGTGALTVVGEGFCSITIKDRDNLANQSSVTVFCPYTTVPALEMTKVKADEKLGESGMTDFLVDTAIDMGKSVLRSLTGKIGVIGLATLVLSFFEKDRYTFSLAECRDTVTDGVIYTVCDWGNESAVIDLNAITAEAIYQNLDYALNIKNEQGTTFDHLAAAVQAELVGKIPGDGIYHLDRMDSRYEYRVVVVADYTTFRMTDYYSNGAITGLGITIQELLEWELSTVADVNNNWMYEIITNDVVGVQNIRLRVEYREKQ